MHIDGLDRSRIRRRFEERFTAELMAANYLAAYQSLISTTQIPKTA
jgi:hypothetical protein